MLSRLLVCTDLDRTLIPNGPQPESPAARPLFRELVAHPEVQLVYVTGRHRQLIEAAIEEYQLPRPDYVIGDVGTSIFSVKEDGWILWSTWHDILTEDWGTLDGPAILSLFVDEQHLTAQESEKQGRFKCSFYTPATVDADALKRRLQTRLNQSNLASHIIWSIDEARQLGLIDILPRKASKLHALRFLMQQTGAKPSTTLFAGDSGNDMEVLISDIPAVLVANATDSIRAQALSLSKAAGTERNFYAARGEFRDMNGNYSAGLLEGLAHFMPETDTWIRRHADA